MDARRWQRAGLPGLLAYLILHHPDARSRRVDRRLRLFAAGCVRRVWPLVERNPACVGLVELAERAAAGLTKGNELDRAVQKSLPSVRRAPEGSAEGFAWHAAMLACCPVVLPRWEWLCAEVARASGDRHAERRAQVVLVRCVFGNPFCPVAFDPSWRTTTVTAIAEGMYADRAFDRLPVLADALEDAGCDHAELLAHLRGPGPHARGCWPVDLVLGKA